MKASLRSGDIIANGGRNRNRGYTVSTEKASLTLHLSWALNE